MNTSPGDVIITNRHGTRIVKVDGKNLPTFENYSYREDDSGFGGTPSSFDVASVLVPGGVGAELSATFGEACVSGSVISSSPHHNGFDDPGLAHKAARKLAMESGTTTTVVKSEGKWIVQPTRSKRL